MPVSVELSDSFLATLEAELKGRPHGLKGVTGAARQSHAGTSSNPLIPFAVLTAQRDLVADSFDLPPAPPTNAS